MRADGSLIIAVRYVSRQTQHSSFWLAYLALFVSAGLFILTLKKRDPKYGQ